MDKGRKRVNQADDMMARITAERLVLHLEAFGFVLMKGQPAAGPRRPACRPQGVETLVQSSNVGYCVSSKFRLR